MKIRSENDKKLHVKEDQKRGTRIEIENSGYHLAGFQHFESKILAESGRLNYKELEGMVYRMELTYDETVDILEVIYIAGHTIGNTIPPRIYELIDITLMIKSLLPNKFYKKIRIYSILFRTIR